MTEPGPNVTKLLIIFISRIAIPPGDDSYEHAARFFADPVWRKEVAAQARQELAEALQAIKAAPDNPWGDDDEQIAGAVLQEVEKRRGR